MFQNNSNSIISKPLYFERHVSVSRAASERALVDIPEETFRLFVSGPCGSGKSTHALVGLCNAKGVKRLVVVQPDDSTKAVCRASLKHLFAKNNLRVVLQVFSAKEFCDQRVSQSRALPGDVVYVVDEVHTRSIYVPAATELVRAKATRYVLITATPGHDHASATGVVSNTMIADRDVTYTRSVALKTYDGTNWDPRNWGNRRRAVAYSVTPSLTSKLVKYYQEKGFHTFVMSRTSISRYDTFAKRMRDPSKPSVLMVLPGVGDGLTIEADVLFDTGYTVDTVCDDNVSYDQVRALTFAESVQRRSRVGRNSSAMVVYGDVRSGKVIYQSMTYYYLNAAVVLRAMSVDAIRVVACLPQRLHGVNRVPKALCVDAVTKGRSDPFDYVVANANDTRCLSSSFQLYTIAGISLPMVFMNTQDDDFSRVGRNLYEMCPASSLSFERAVSMWTADKIRYRIALLSILFGRSGYYSKQVDVIKHCGDLLRSLQMSLSEYDKWLVQFATSVRRGSRGYKYSNKFAPNSGMSDIIDTHDLKQGLPQRNFARVVAWISNMRNVNIGNSIIASSKLLDALQRGYLRGKRVGEAIKPGPNKSTLASRLYRWSNGYNADVVIKVIENGHEYPEFRTWQQLNTVWKAHETGDMRQDLSARSVIAYVKRDYNSDSCVIWNGESIRISLVGFSLHLSSQVIGENIVEFARLEYVDYSGELRMKKCGVLEGGNKLLPPKPVTHPIYEVKGAASVFRTRRCAASKLWRWSIAKSMGLTFSLRENPRCTSFEQLDRVWDKTVAMRLKPHTFSVSLVVHFRLVEEGDGSAIATTEFMSNFEIVGFSIVESEAVLSDVAAMSYVNGASKACGFEVRIDAEVSAWVDIHDVNEWGGAAIDHDPLHGIRVGDAIKPGPTCCRSMQKLYLKAYRQGLGRSNACSQKDDKAVLRDGKREFKTGSGIRVKFYMNQKGRIGCARRGQAGFYIKVPKAMCKSCLAVHSRVKHDYKKGYRFGDAIKPGPLSTTSVDHDWKSGIRMGDAIKPGPDPVPPSVTEEVDVSQFNPEPAPRIGAVRNRRRIAPSALNAQITSTGHGDLSPLESDALDVIERRYDEGSYFVNLTFFAVETDGSEKYERTMAVVLNLAGGNGESRLLWSSLFSEMMLALDEGRFTLRRYLSLRAPLLIEYFLYAPALVEWFSSGTCSLSSRFPDAGTAVRSLSWATANVRADERGKIAQLNRTRQITVEGEYHGDISGFSHTRNNVRAAEPPKVENNDTIA